MHELDEVLQHFGVKGMRWGVRRDNPGSSKTKVNDATKKRGREYVKQHAKNTMRSAKITRARMDIRNRDIKTGEYTNQSKTAKVLRGTERVLDVVNLALTMVLR
jgi:hypothetical protein